VRKRRSPSGGSGSGSPRSGSRLRRAGSKLRSWAPSSSSYAAAEGVTIAALVTYDVIGAPEVKLPRPGPIVAAMGFYAALAAVGSVSRSFEPVVAGVGWVLALSVLVTGQRGKGLLGLFQRFAQLVQGIGQAPAVGASQ
jgi:hypothetical protein